MIEEFTNFLSISECQELIGLCESKTLTTGKIRTKRINDFQDDSFNYSHPDKNSGYRKAQVAWINEPNELVDKIKVKVSELSNISVSLQEPFHIVKYTSGGEYKPHFDGVFRSKTALIYLNESFVGGETEFPKINRVIKPEVGKLVIWRNTLSNNKIDPDSFHSGRIVEFGTKYIAVIWIGNDN
jgi:prolyl 4-hydroxylase